MNASPGLLAAIERGAREQGIWWGSETTAFAPGLTTISFNPITTMYMFRPWRLDVTGRATSFADETTEADALTASVYVMLAGLTVERPCPDCDGRRETTTKLPPRQPDGAEWLIGPCTSCAPPCDECTDGLRYSTTGNGDVAGCQRCEGGGRLGPTGRVHVEARRRLLDAMPCSNCAAWSAEVRRMFTCNECDAPHGAPEARADMLALAYRESDPETRVVFGDWRHDHPTSPLASCLFKPRGGIGGVLALWLAGELREEHVLGEEVRRGYSSGVDQSSAEFIARTFLKSGALSADVEQLPDMQWEASCHKAHPVLEARPT